MPQASSNEIPYNHTANCDKDENFLVRVEPELCGRCGKRRPRSGESIPKLLGGRIVEIDGMTIEVPAEDLPAFDFCGCGWTIIVP